MCHPLAKHLRLGIFSVGVDQVPIAGERGEVDDVGLGDRAADALHAVANLEFFKVEPGYAGQFSCGHRFSLGWGMG